MPGDRRTALVEAATDYVLERGLIGLSLRPLARALGTSDRMLLYHFADKDELVGAVITHSYERALALIRRLPPSAGPEAAVLDLWAAVTTPGLLDCQRLYVEAAALGLFGREPYVSLVRAGNVRWMAALRGHLVASGVPEARAARAALLTDATFNGFLLDRPLGAGDPEAAEASHRAVRDLAAAVAALADD